MRYPCSIAGGIVIAVALFFVMDGLIAATPERPQGQALQLDTTYLLKTQEDVVNTKVRIPDPPEPPKVPPRPPTLTTSTTTRPAQDIPNIDLPAISALGSGHGPWLPNGRNPIAADQDLVAIIKMSPEYPRSAALEGTEGWVDIELVVAADGTVAEARVVDSQPARVFDRAALRALYRWKFEPRRVDGIATQRTAIMRMEFSL